MVQPYNIGEGKKSKKERAREREESLAEELGGKRVPNSGGIKHGCGDVISCGITMDGILWEDKYTDYKSYRLKKETWEKISKEALCQESMKEPAMEVEIDSSGDPLNLVILEKETFKALFDEIQRLRRALGSDTNG